MSEQERYELKHPVKIKLKGPEGEREEEIREIPLRRLKGKDLRVFDSAPGPIGGMLALIARLGGITIAQADEIDAEDIAGLTEKIEAFMPPGLRTGGTSSAT